MAPSVVAAFQPIFDLRDMCVIGYEALARPRDGTPPEELFAQAREDGPARRGRPRVPGGGAARGDARRGWARRWRCS